MVLRSRVFLPIVLLLCVWQVQKKYTDGDKNTQQISSYFYGKKAEETKEIVKHIESRQKAESEDQSPTKLDSRQDILSEHLASRRDILAPRFSSRVSRLQEVCTSMTSEEVSQTARIWSVNPRHKLVMCRTSKHGSTTWASLFVQLYSRSCFYI